MRDISFRFEHFAISHVLSVQQESKEFLQYFE